MRSAYTNRRSIAQRARRDAEDEAKPIRQGPPQMPHGAVIGRIVIEYHGQRVEVELLQAGERCRSHGVRIDLRGAGGNVYTLQPRRGYVAWRVVVDGKVVHCASLKQCLRWVADQQARCSAVRNWH